MTGETTLTTEQHGRAECARWAAGVLAEAGRGDPLASELIEVAAWIYSGAVQVYDTPTVQPEPCCQDRDPRHVERTFGMPEPEVMTA